MVYDAARRQVVLFGGIGAGGNRRRAFMVSDSANQSKRSIPLNRQIPLATIDRVVTENLGPARVRGKAQPEALFRQIAMYLAKHVGGWSTTRIGKFYNGRDHSTVCHAIARIRDLRKSDADVDALIQSLAQACKREATAAVPARSTRVADSLKDVLVRRIEASLNELADGACKTLSDPEYTTASGTRI